MVIVSRFAASASSAACAGAEAEGEDAHAVSTLSRLLRKVKVNGAAGAEAGGEEPAAKKPKPSIIAINLPGYNMPPSVVASLNDELEAWKKVELCESTQAFLEGAV